MKRVLDAIHEKLRKTRPSGQDGKDTFLASLRRIAKVASQDHDLYGTSLIVGYGMGMGRGQGFDTVNPEDLEDHIDRVTRLEVDNSVLAEVNEILSARVVELEKRLEVDHLFAGEDMVREDVPPEERLSIPDGVTARDAAIELQKGFIDKQEARISDLETALENAKYKISQLEMDHAELAGIDAKCTALCVENAQLRYQVQRGIGSGGAGGAAGKAGEPGK